MIGMHITKTLAQTGLYFYLVWVIAQVQPNNIPPFFMMLLVTAALVLSYLLRNKGILRYLPLLLIPMTLLFASLVDVFTMVIPMTAFVFFTARKQNYLMTEDKMRTAQPYWSGALLVCVILASMSRADGFSFILIAIIAGVFLSRNLRHDYDTMIDPVYKRYNTVIVFSVLLIALPFLAVATGLGDWLRHVMNEGFYNFLMNISTYMDLDFPAWWVLELEFGGSAETSIAVVFDALDSEDLNLGLLASALFYYLFYLLPLTIVIIIYIIITLRKVFGASGSEFQNTMVVYAREHVNIQRKALHDDAEHGTHHQNGIRKTYRKFLRLLKKRKTKILPNHTSAHIGALSQETVGQSGDALRSLYLKARYAQDETTTDDVHQAKHAYQQFVKSIN